ncbi:MAG: GNAT family N-acetyltransferase [Oscillospiraceae bacterium]|nr:GNAT family N-acetyltransferase [Oscillospiraceae bacterium]
MITKVDSTNKERFISMCKAEHVFGSRALTALSAYGTDHNIHKFWIMTENGTDAAALHLNGQVLTVIKENMVGTDDIVALTREFEIHEIDSDWDLCEKLHAILGGFTESSYYMTYTGEEITEDFPDIKTACLRDVYSVLRQSHEYYRTHLKYDPWATHLESCIKAGCTEVYQLERDGKAIGTGSIISQDETHAAIAAVAVIPEYRLKGIGSYITLFLVKEILKKGKTPCLISGYDEVAELYKKIDFVTVGRWGELYI